MTKVRILRYDPSKAGKPRYQVYEVPTREKMSVLGVFRYIYEELDSSLAYTGSCRFGRCGGCTVMVNGAARLACLTLATEEMTIEPLRGFAVIKDLVVDHEKRRNRVYLRKRRMIL
jgi:succinate dehydrogenase/fumarate reductase iron-sulfur protein